jgi:hypothetical protein
MKAIVYDTLTLNHKKHPIQFKIGVGFVGNVKNGRINNLDLNNIRNNLENFNLLLRDKEIFEFFKGYKGMETIAIYFFKNFSDTINTTIDFIEILENNTEKIIVYKEDII